MPFCRYTGRKGGVSTSPTLVDATDGAAEKEGAVVLTGVLEPQTAARGILLVFRSRRKPIDMAGCDILWQLGRKGIINTGLSAPNCTG